MNLTVADSANADFVAAGNQGSKTVTIAAGATMTVYNVATVGDSNDEPDGPVTVTVASSSDYTLGTSSSATVRVNDDEPTQATLVRVGSTATLTEGGATKADRTVEFTVRLSRALIAGERIDVPLVFSGTNVTAADLDDLTRKTGTGLDTGVTLSGAGTLTPLVVFQGAGAQTATLELAVTDDSAVEADETLTAALGPDGTGTNGFDRTALGTNVGGGADPHTSGVPAVTDRFTVTLASNDNSVNLSVSDVDHK